MRNFVFTRAYVYLIRQPTARSGTPSCLLFPSEPLGKLHVHRVRLFPATPVLPAPAQPPQALGAADGPSEHAPVHQGKEDAEEAAQEEEGDAAGHPGLVAVRADEARLRDGLAAPLAAVLATALSFVAVSASIAATSASRV